MSECKCGKYKGCERVNKEQYFCDCSCHPPEKQHDREWCANCVFRGENVCDGIVKIKTDILNTIMECPCKCHAPEKQENLKKENMNNEHKKWCNSVSIGTWSICNCGLHNTSNNFIHPEKQEEKCCECPSKEKPSIISSHSGKKDGHVCFCSCHKPIEQQDKECKHHWSYRLNEWANDNRDDGGISDLLDYLSKT